MAIKKLNAKNTKAEILAAYNDLTQEKKTLEAKLVAAQTIKPEPIVSQPRQSEPKAKPKNLITASESPQIESIIQALNRLQLNFGGAASSLSEQLTAEVLKLQDIQTAVAEASEQLETLHELQFADDSLTTLIESYEADTKRFQTEFEQRQEELDLALTTAQKDWAQEQEDRARTIQERNELQGKLRRRDAKEYTYTLALDRKLSDEDYDQTQKQRYQELADLREAQEKLWTERESAIAEREKELEELKTKVDGLPDELEKAIKKAKEEGKGIAQHQAKIKSDLVAQEVTGQKQAYELRIGALQDTIETQSDRIQALSNQLAAALKQVQDLAVKAIEGAANLSSLKSIREIAIEQAKNPSKNK